MTGAGIDVWLIMLNPQDFGRGEAGQRVVARDLNQALFADPAPDFIALFACTLVVPQDSRAQDVNPNIVPLSILRL